MLPVPAPTCSCQQLQQFLQQLHERVQSVEGSVSTIHASLDTFAIRSEVEPAAAAVAARVSSLEESTLAFQQSLQLPDDMLR